MVRIINAFRGESPIGNVLTQLGQQLFGDQAGASINREQAYALQRSNVETDNLAREFAEGRGGTLSPTAQAMLISSGIDPNDLGRVGALGAATQFGARDPRTTNWSAGLGEYGNTAEAFDLDLAEVTRNNNLQSDDRRYNVNQNVAQDRYEFDRTPQAAMVDGRMVFVPQRDAFNEGVGYIPSQAEAQAMKFLEMFPGMTELQQLTGVDAAPSLDQTRADVAGTALGTPGGLAGLDANTRTFVGAEARAPGTSWNYITPDGKVYITNDTAHANGMDAQGRPLPPDGTRGELQATDMGGLAPAARSDLDKMEFALFRLDNTATRLIEAIDAADPRSFGLAGAVADLGRGAVTAVANLAGLLGVEDLSATSLRQRFASTPQDPNDPVQPGTWDLLFNPQSTELQTLGGIFLWQAAAALAGQGGRELSNADMTRVIDQFGSPTSWGTDQVRYREKIVSLQNYVQDQLALVQAYQANQGAPAAGGAATAAPTTTTEGGLPAGWTQRPDGTMVTPDGIEIRVGSP